MVLWISALQRSSGSGEAKHAAYMKKLSGYYVNCFVTGEEIALSDLKYWNVERQEPYKDAEAGLKRHTATTGCT